MRINIPLLAPIKLQGYVWNRPRADASDARHLLCLCSGLDDDQRSLAMHPVAETLADKAPSLHIKTHMAIGVASRGPRRRKKLDGTNEQIDDGGEVVRQAHGPCPPRDLSQPRYSPASPPMRGH